MADSIPILWSEDIAVDVLTPEAILRAQVEPLRRMTKGILLAEVTTASGDTRTRIDLDLIAPALGGYRHRILSANHERDLAYPVRVEAECFRPLPTKPLDPIQLASPFIGLNPEDWRPVAASDKEFIELVGKALRSREVRGVINSLIARSNEENPRKTGLADPSTGGADSGVRQTP